MFLSECHEFPSALCLAGKKKNLMTARVSMLLKSCASLACFQACFLPGRAKDLSVLYPCTSYTDNRDPLGRIIVLSCLMGNSQSQMEHVIF